MKFIVVTGGVLSGLGKGTFMSAIAQQFQYLCPTKQWTHIKIDPYLNIDAGTLRPSEHGEVYVLQDGGEVDLDLGNYERATGIQLTKHHNITLGKILTMLMQQERAGNFRGDTVTHSFIYDRIVQELRRIAKIPVSVKGAPAKTPDVCLVEIGGTVGDKDTDYFTCALGSMQKLMGAETVQCVHMCPLLRLQNGEWKTRPIRKSIDALRTTGLEPSFIVLRCAKVPTSSIDALCAQVAHKLAWSPNDICMVPDKSNTMHLLHPRSIFHHTEFSKLAPLFGIDGDIPPPPPVIPMSTKRSNVHIAIVGKYANAPDAYHSLRAALSAVGYAQRHAIRLTIVDADDDEIFHTLQNIDGVIVAGGFGARGIEGKVKVCTWCKTHNVPILGICLGLQCMAISAARELAASDDEMSNRWKGATSMEYALEGPFAVVAMKSRKTDFDPDPDPVIPSLLGDLGKDAHCPPMCVGAKTSTCVSSFWPSGTPMTLTRRHRHRYQVSSDLVDDMVARGGYRVIARVTPIPSRYRRIPPKTVHGMQYVDHPYYVGVQYHPEFGMSVQSPPFEFMALVAAAHERAMLRLRSVHK